MKQGKTLSELAAEIDRRRNAKRDFIAPTQCLALETKEDPADRFRILVKDHAGGSTGYRFKPNELFHDQVGQRLKIPAAYYDRMRQDAPDLLCENVNHWFLHTEEKRMVRTLDNTARAFLSDRYRELDNADLAEAVLPVLYDFPGIEVVSCEVTDRRMYIKAINKRITGEVTKGDIVQAGVAIRNSEVGCGALAIEPLIYRLVCLNGLISTDNTIRKYHVGRINGNEESDNWEIFNDATKEASDKAVWLQVRDLTRASLQESLFRQQVVKIQEAAGQKIEGDPAKVVEVVQKHFSLNDGDRGGILRHLIEGGDLSRWGLVNAITRHSQDVDDYDKATDLERMGGQVIELKQKDWKKIAEIAA